MEKVYLFTLLKNLKIEFSFSDVIQSRHYSR